MILRLTLFSLFPRLILSESGFITSKQGPFPFLWQPVRDITYIYAVLLGTVSREKNAVLLDFVQITPPPIWTTCTTFFRQRNSRFESQFRTKNTIYTICIYNLNKQFKVQIIGILEEIDSFY